MLYFLIVLIGLNLLVHAYRIYNLQKKVEKLEAGLSIESDGIDMLFELSLLIIDRLNTQPCPTKCDKKINKPLTKKK